MLIWNPAYAEAILDGKIFSGMLGPKGNPQQPDSIYFDKGYFWSDICSRCGFEPGLYSVKMTEEGVAFSGILESKSRGQFTYDGLVRQDGSMAATIEWERRRWYWTSQRTIVFQGSAADPADAISLDEVQLQLQNIDTSTNPLCARF